MNNKQGFGDLSDGSRNRELNMSVSVWKLPATYGDELATYLYDAGHLVSIVNPVRIKGFAQSELLRTRMTRLMPV